MWILFYPPYKKLCESKFKGPVYDVCIMLIKTDFNNVCKRTDAFLHTLSYEAER